MGQGSQKKCANCGSQNVKKRKFCSVECYRVAQRSGHYIKPVESHKSAKDCERCGVVFSGGAGRFCSRGCYDLHREEHRPSCKLCGRRVALESRIYCSMECRKKDKKAPPIHCRQCGVWFTGLKSPRRSRAGNITWTTDRQKTVCSAECKSEFFKTNQARKEKISAAFKGERHPNWMGGRSRTNSVNKRGPTWRVQRKKALKRDNYRCVTCGKTEEENGRSLDVDHIEPFHNFTTSKEANKLSNLRSLCKACHGELDNKWNPGNQMALPLGKVSHKGYCRGARVNTAKLSEVDVLAIKRKCKAGAKQADVAREYGVTNSCIYSITSGRSWKHLQNL